MKKMIRMGIALLGLAGILTLCGPVCADEISVGDWVYLLENGTASIARYTGTDSEITVPTSAEIGGQSYRIRTIEALAFEDCRSLSSVIIPEEITAVGHAAFRNCTMLSYLEIQGNLSDCSAKSIGANGEYFETDRSINNSVFYNTGNNAPEFSVVFADTVTRIPSYLFATSPDKGEDAYAHITSVEIGNKTAEIGEYAFYRCFDLKNVVFGENLTRIGNYAFSENTSLKELSFNELLFAIGEYAFAGDESLETVAFNPKLSEIGAGAFGFCTSLTSVDIPDSVMTIGAYSFENCSRLRDVRINGLQGIEISLGEAAFRNCTFLSNLVINANVADCPSKSVKSNDEYFASDRTENNSVFYNTGNNADPFRVVFTDLVTRIPAYLFATGSPNSADVYAHITEAVIGNNVTEISDYAFFRCFNLKTVWMGSQIGRIGENAFGEDNLLEQVQYTGEQNEWENIEIEGNNDFLESSSRDYDVEEEAVEEAAAEAEEDIAEEAPAEEAAEEAPAAEAEEEAPAEEAAEEVPAEEAAEEASAAEAEEAPAEEAVEEAPAAEAEEEASAAESAAEEAPAQEPAEEPAAEAGEARKEAAVESAAQGGTGENASYALSILDQAGVLDESRSSEYLDLVHEFSEKTGGWFLFFSTADTGAAEAYDKWDYFDRIVEAFADTSLEEGGIAVVYNSKDGTVMADTYGRVGEMITDDEWDEFFSLMTQPGDMTDKLAGTLAAVNSWWQ